MANNKKGRAGCHRATFKTILNSAKRTTLITHVKGGIEVLAIWGLLPVAIAEWLLRKGGAA